MSEEEAQIEGFSIELRLDCTVKSGQWDFIKPGASTIIKFDSIPSEKQIRDAMKFMNEGILEPALEDTIIEIQKRL